MTAQSKLPPFALDGRDLALLRTLLECRLMTLLQAAAIHFGGSYDAAKKRMQILKALGLVEERFWGSNKPRTLHVSPKGIALLAEAGIPAQYTDQSPSELERRAIPSAWTVSHERQVMDVKAAFHAKVVTLEEFNTWPALHEFAVTGAGDGQVVKPDGFIRILNHAKNVEDMLFLELDRATETLDILVSKLTAYISYSRSGDFARHIAGPSAIPSQHPFRVLVVVPSEERRNNVAERLLATGISALGIVWLTTFQEVCADPLSPCWVRPQDYREAIASMPAARLHYRREYRRQTLRDAHIKSRIRKHPLMDKEKGDRLAA